MLLLKHTMIEGIMHAFSQCAECHNCFFLATSLVGSVNEYANILKQGSTCSNSNANAEDGKTVPGAYLSCMPSLFCNPLTQINIFPGVALLEACVPLTLCRPAKLHVPRESKGPKPGGQLVCTLPDCPCNHEATPHFVVFDMVAAPLL